MQTRSKPIPILLLLLGIYSCTYQPPSVLPNCPTDYESTDAIMTSCPLDCELSAIGDDFSIVFDVAADLPQYNCRDGQDPGGGENPRLVLNQLLRTAAALRFEQPLPWTDLSLYEWLRGAVDGFVVREAPESYCCDDQGRIVLSLESLLLPLPLRWDSPHRGIALCDLTGLVIHQARHAEVGPHSCGGNDTSLDELGPWGAQYYFYVWMAEHSPPGMLSDLQVQCAIAHAQMNLINYCNP